MVKQLNEFESDSLGELINIAMGVAASKLQELTSAEVEMSVPNVRLMPVDEYKKMLEEENRGELISVSESFSGSFSGNAVLIFHFDKSLNLVNSLLPDNASDDEFFDMEEEVVTEIGNILLNSCIATFANVLSKEFQTDIPRFNKGSIQHIIDKQLSFHEGEQVFLLAEINFSLETLQTSGHMVLTLTLPFLKSLLQDLYAATGVDVPKAC